MSSLPEEAGGTYKLEYNMSDITIKLDEALQCELCDLELKVRTPLLKHIGIIHTTTLLRDNLDVFCVIFMLKAKDN